MSKPHDRSKLPLPEQYGNANDEDTEQIRLFCWAALPDTQEKYPELKWMFHIPNGGYRNKRLAGKLRAMGVKRGVPDICLPIRRGAFPALWIELKRPAIKNVQRAGILRNEQGPWLDHLHAQGHAKMKCVGWEAARDTIVSYLEWKE